MGDGGEVRDRRGDPRGRTGLAPLLGQVGGAAPDLGHPGGAARGQAGEGCGGERPGRAQVGRRRQGQEDGHRTVVDHGGDGPGRGQPPARGQTLRPGGQRDDHLGGLLAERCAEEAGRGGARAGAAGQRLGQWPAEVVVVGPVGQQPSRGRGQVDGAAASAGSSVASGSIRPPSRSHR